QDQFQLYIFSPMDFPLYIFLLLELNSPCNHNLRYQAGSRYRRLLKSIVSVYHYCLFDNKGHRANPLILLSICWEKDKPRNPVNDLSKLPSPAQTKDIDFPFRDSFLGIEG